jgi:hypothetical protein
LSYNRYVMRMLPLLFLAAVCAAPSLFANEAHQDGHQDAHHEAHQEKTPAASPPAVYAAPDSSRDTVKPVKKAPPKVPAKPVSNKPANLPAVISETHAAPDSKAQAKPASKKPAGPAVAHPTPAKAPAASHAESEPVKPVKPSEQSAYPVSAPKSHAPKDAEDHGGNPAPHLKANPEVHGAAHGNEKSSAKPVPPTSGTHGRKAEPVHEEGHGTAGAAHSDKHGAATGTTHGDGPKRVQSAGAPDGAGHEAGHGEKSVTPHGAGHEKTPVDSHGSGHPEGHGDDHGAKPTAAHEDAHHGAAPGHGKEHTDHESAGQPHGSRDSEIPQMAGRPDTAFARAADWEKGTAEVLSYSVTRKGKTGPIQCRGNLVTERMYLMPDGTTDRKPAGKAWLEILNTVLSASGEDGGLPFALETVAKFPRKEHMRLLRQDQSWQSWPGSTHRILDCRVAPPRLRVVSSGGEVSRDTVIGRWPVFTEEMLFTYLRSVPHRAGYREEVWFQDWGAEGRFAIQPQFATISVRSKAPAIRDMETWYITVDREDGRRSEFWVSATGLHPVVLAVLVDRSTWTLREITRKKYWAW